MLILGLIQWYTLINALIDKTYDIEKAYWNMDTFKTIYCLVNVLCIHV